VSTNGGEPKKPGRWFASGLSGAPRNTQGRKSPQGVAAINPVMHQKASEEGVHPCSPRAPRKTRNRGPSSRRVHTRCDAGAVGHSCRMLNIKHRRMTGYNSSTYSRVHSLGETSASTFPRSNAPVVRSRPVRFVHILTFHRKRNSVREHVIRHKEERVEQRPRQVDASVLLLHRPAFHCLLERSFHVVRLRMME
jgi:hypothetical protein